MAIGTYVFDMNPGFWTRVHAEDVRRADALRAKAVAKRERAAERRKLRKRTTAARQQGEHP